MFGDKEEKPVKKGNPSWRPHKTLEVRNQRPGMRLRWVNTDPANLEKKQAEGWKFAETTEHDRAKGVEHGKGLGSVKQYRDLVLMEMPEELAVARNEYFQNETKAQVGGITKRLKSKLAESGSAATYGDVQINDKPL